MICLNTDTAIFKCHEAKTASTLCLIYVIHVLIDSSASLFRCSLNKVTHLLLDHNAAEALFRPSTTELMTYTHTFRGHSMRAGNRASEDM